MTLVEPFRILRHLVEPSHESEHFHDFGESGGIFGVFVVGLTELVQRFVVVAELPERLGNQDAWVDFFGGVNLPAEVNRLVVVT